MAMQVCMGASLECFFFSSRRRHTRSLCDWSSDVCSSDLIKTNETVLVVLDSNHDKQHVLKELEAYCSLVTPGSYIVATDGVRRDMADVPRGKIGRASCRERV